MAPVTHPTQIEFLQIDGDLPDDAVAGKFTAGQLTAPYTAWRGQSQYVSDTHRIQLPIAGGCTNPTGPTSVVIQTACTTSQRTIRFRAVRDGDWPILPRPADSFVDESRVTHTLLQTIVVPETPVPTPGDNVNGVPLMKYRMLVDYVYALSRPHRINERLRTAVDPRLLVFGSHFATSTGQNTFSGGTP